MSGYAANFVAGFMLVGALIQAVAGRHEAAATYMIAAGVFSLAGKEKP